MRRKYVSLSVHTSNLLSLHILVGTIPGILSPTLTGALTADGVSFI